MVIECGLIIYGNIFKLNDECVVGWKMFFFSKNFLLFESISKKFLLVKKFNYVSKEFLLLLVKIFYI